MHQPIYLSISPLVYLSIYPFFFLFLLFSFPTAFNNSTFFTFLAKCSSLSILIFFIFYLYTCLFPIILFPLLLIHVPFLPFPPLRSVAFIFYLTWNSTYLSIYPSISLSIYLIFRLICLHTISFPIILCFTLLFLSHLITALFLYLSITSSLSIFSSFYPFFLYIFFPFFSIIFFIHFFFLFFPY